MAVKPQTGAIGILLFLVLLLATNWRIDRTKAQDLQLVVDACVFKHGFVIETKNLMSGARETYGIVCGRAEEFHNSAIVQPYEVWPVWKLQ